MCQCPNFLSDFLKTGKVVNWNRVQLVWFFVVVFLKRVPYCHTVVETKEINQRRAGNKESRKPGESNHLRNSVTRTYEPIRRTGTEPSSSIHRMILGDGVNMYPVDPAFPCD